MAQCKCGLSGEYPECDGMHKIVTNNETLRQAIINAFEEWQTKQI
jgi:CDGSH-type Zn-finger protein